MNYDQSGMNGLSTALRKREEGRGLKNSEISMLRSYDKAPKDPFSKVPTWPASTGTVPGDRDAKRIGGLGAQIKEGVHSIVLPSQAGGDPSYDFGPGIAMREWDVCDSGTPAKALFLSSLPYAP